jgi:hypothetical protein
MKLSLKQVKKLIAWVEEHQEMVETLFPVFNEMKVTMPKLRGKEKELVQVLTKEDDEQ